MKITFKDYQDKILITSALIFAQHDQHKILQMREFDEGRAEQMEWENEQWFQMRQKIAHGELDITL